MEAPRSVPSSTFDERLSTDHISGPPSVEQLSEPSSVPVEQPSTFVEHTIPPPPEQEYESRQTALEAIHSFTKEHGYEVVLRKPKKNKNGQIFKYNLECKRHGKLSNTRKLETEDRRRVNRSSIRIGCPMRIIFGASIRDEPEGPWNVQYTGRESVHNHAPDDVLALPGHRKRSRTDDVSIKVNANRC